MIADTEANSEDLRHITSYSFAIASRVTCLIRGTEEAASKAVRRRTALRLPHRLPSAVGTASLDLGFVR